MDTRAYLSRIKYDGPLDPTLDTLRSLHVAHLLNVPFENLDIVMGRPIILDKDRFFRKIVEERRGGFCYELNGSFAMLLREVGFDVTLLSARVQRNDDRMGPEFDHLTLRVELDQPWLADVGFGECFMEPIPLSEDCEQTQQGVTYRLTSDTTGGRWLLMNRKGDSEWHVLYAFSLQPRELKEFSGMCHYHQTSPDSHFTQRRVCSMATPNGRVTIADMRLIESEGDNRQERAIESDQEYRVLLRELFGINLPATL